MNRKAYLDNLKLFLTLLVVFHHAGQPHVEGAFWPFRFSDSSMIMPWMWHFFSTNASFFMGLFFLIAGYFVPKSFDKQGVGKFVRKKLVHLGVPCILMTAVLSIMVGRMEIGHMWFVENLLFFSLLYALFRVLFRKNISYKVREPRLWQLLIFALVMGVIVQIVRHFSPQDKWINILRILYFEPARYPQYLMMFLLGVIACRLDFFEKMNRKTGLICLLSGCLLALGNYLRAGGAWDGFVTRWFGFYESLMCVSISFGLIWLFRERFNGSNRFLSWACSQSYMVYIIHLPLMVGLEFATEKIYLPAFWKFLFVGILATIASFVLSWLINSLITRIKACVCARRNTGDV